MRRIRFIHQRAQVGFTWKSLVYLRPKPAKPGVDIEDFTMESGRYFPTEAEARHNLEEIERKLGLKFNGS